jgi:hypothetical protein
MDFWVNVFFLPTIICNEVVLKRGLDFLIIPVSVPRFSLHNLRSIVIHAS